MQHDPTDTVKAFAGIRIAQTQPLEPAFMLAKVLFAELL
jgi:hypothetical protein